ncbi:TM2 domain-containing protein [Vicingus serpentipes]|jgi:TM2 domain-containing protein|uniref:TM2 domain-containing protein n=1 Tax=Vicingus serpentipes TaxID=1926625 RepID=A0A5C6RR48_9FLAO|nr:NINE protein [Vicingus serpentipes]TXB64667.1 TM2 domain-containing protein [Vicingus serpentipes]
MYKKITFCFLFFTSVFFAKAEKTQFSFQDTIFAENKELINAGDSIQPNKKAERKHVRVKAIIFTILTGPLGGHRVYLRTRPGAPIIYAVTLGGFGILPLVDLAHLIFKKDISSFEENPKIMMWTK